MSGTTTKGYPYILGADSASSIDDTSLALANKLDAVVPYAMAAGSVTVTITSSSTGNASVTFPTSRFTLAPLVVCSLASAPSGSQKVIARAINSTTTGCSVYVYTGDSTTTTCTVVIHWWAVQMTTTTSNG